jgi:hypothetical protein
MKFSTLDKEKVLEYWQDISQDLDFISKETGFELIKVLNILEELQNNNEISGFKKIERKVDESRILLFEELVSPEAIKQLGLDKFTKTTSDKDYFFDKKEINDIYDGHVFTVTVKSINSTSDFIFLPLEVDFKNRTYKIIVFYYSSGELYYGSDLGKKH